MINNSYCHVCGTKLEPRANTNEVTNYCVKCERPVYQDPKVATCTLITNAQNAVLLAKRALEPGLGKWALPGGYVNRGEVVEEAAKREVFEETGLLCEITELLGVFSVKDASPILIVYQGFITGGEITPSNETPEVEFFTTDKLPPLSFARDEDIIKKASSTN